jgi:hypothetical protein
MNINKSPTPRANAGSRANSKAQQHQIIASAVDWEADPATIWFARRFPLSTRLARVLAALASLGRAFSMNGPINFAEINRAALAAFPAVLARILPGGKRVGAEIVALNPRRADRRLGSFKVNRYNGRWADFASGHKGDPISLVAYLADVSQGEAARLLAQMLGLETGGCRHG